MQQAINAPRADRTVILVAHRLTTLLDTDRIFVIDEGRVAETGTYEQLVELDGVSPNSSARPKARSAAATATAMATGR